MGLLLGGSVMTIIEMLDLIFYNLVRKSSSSRERPHPGTSNNVEKAEPVSYTNKAMVSDSTGF